LSIDFIPKESNLINDVQIIIPTVSSDERGNIWSSFQESNFQNFLPNEVKFNHDKFSTSKKNVLRGIHGDTKSWKLVTCVSGKIQQVVVDFRKSSSTYKTWESFIIDCLSPKMILIPPGVGNAYCVLSEEAVYHYKLAYEGNYFDADQQFTHSWNDKSIGIDWSINDPILSKRDRNEIY